MVDLAIASGCIEDVYPRNLAHTAIFECPLRFAHFGPKFLQFGGFRYAIQYAKFALQTGVNYKSKDAIPHDGYTPEDPGAIYAVRVRNKYTSREHFLEEYQSNYMNTLGGGLRATGAHIYMHICMVRA